MPRPASHSVHVIALGFWLSRLAESGRTLACLPASGAGRGKKGSRDYQRDAENGRRVGVVLSGVVVSSCPQRDV